jgi:hypothetical protein
MKTPIKVAIRSGTELPIAMKVEPATLQNMASSTFKFD